MTLRTKSVRKCRYVCQEITELHIEDRKNSAQNERRDDAARALSIVSHGEHGEWQECGQHLVTGETLQSFNRIAPALKATLGKVPTECWTIGSNDV